MRLSLGNIWTTLKESFRWYGRDKASVWSSSLSYFTVFSLAPLVLLLVSVLGLFVSKATVEKNITAEIQTSMGRQSGKLIQTIIESSKKPSAGIVGTVVGFIFLLIGASGVFAQLKQMLNYIWGVEQKKRLGVWGFIRDRFLNMSLVASIAFLLLVSFVATTAISTLGGYFRGVLPLSPFVYEIINFLISFVVTTFLFALIFKVLPDVKISWKHVWLGAIVTAILFTIGKSIIGWYIGFSSVSSSYGAAGSLIALLLWVYYAAQILFFGAEYTKMFTVLSDRKVIPSTYGTTVRDVAAPYKNYEKKRNVILETATSFTEGFVKETVKKTVGSAKGQFKKKGKKKK